MSRSASPRSLRRAALILASIAVLSVVTACSGPLPDTSTGAPAGSAGPSPEPSATLPPGPVSAFPDLDCDTLVTAATIASLLGDGAAPQPPTIDDASVLQDGGLICSWADPASGGSLTVRLVGDGVDHWATFNHWYEHTDWSDRVGEINGTMCSAEGCSVHALGGDRFIEVDAAGFDDPDGIRSEEVARAALTAAPVPVAVPVATGSAPEPGSRSCTAALPVDTATAILGASAGASYVSTATPSYHLAQDSLQRVGGIDCRLLSADSRELLRFTVLPGGTWLFRDDSPLEVPDGADAGDSTQAQRGDDWVRLQAPGASEANVQTLLAQLLG